uniref:Uncharacterized protein n=1 Tax=Daphnia magna TaxID=35525 RepID=A0A0P6HNH7_9CRUS
MRVFPLVAQGKAISFMETCCLAADFVSRSLFLLFIQCILAYRMCIYSRSIMMIYTHGPRSFVVLCRLWSVTLDASF